MKKIRMIKSIYDNPQAESHLRLANDKAQSEAAQEGQRSPVLEGLVTFLPRFS